MTELFFVRSAILKVLATVFLLCMFAWPFTNVAAAKNNVSNSSSVPAGDMCGVVNNMDMYSQRLDEALQYVQQNPEKAEQMLALEDTALALAYRAYLRECGMINPKGASDSAEALLDRAYKKLPPELQAQMDSQTNWDGASQTMNKILNTLFSLHSHYLQ